VCRPIIGRSIRGNVFRTAVVIVCAVALTACTVAVEGQAGRLGADLGLPPVPVISEGPARWAMSALDPCALARGAPLDTARDSYPIRPHSCAADYAPAGATEWWKSPLSDTLYTRVGADVVELPRLVVHVGAKFDTSDRSKMAEVDFGGRTAYQAYGEHFPAPEINSLDWRCRIDFPISADRSIQIVSSAVEGGDSNTACTAPRTVAETVAAKLVSPAASARTSPRWSACDLVEQATGYIADDRGVADFTADTCTARGPTAGGKSTPTLEIDTIAGPDSLEPARFSTETRVDLPFGAALQNKVSEDQCTVEFVTERQPEAPAEFAAQVTSVRLAGSPGDPCAGAADAATKIHNTLSGPAPQPPPAPAHLGFAVGEPDAEIPSACGVFTSPSADEIRCGVPVPAPVPATAQDVLRDGESPIAPYMSCAILRDAAAPVTGDAIELAAIINRSGGGCVGLTNDAYAVYLAFFAQAAAGEYCIGTEKQEVQIAGRTAIRCSPNTGTFHLYLPATPDPGAKGVALVESRLVTPRGDMSWDSGNPDPAAEALMADGTTRIAENVINQRLSG
jgi:hypothetical protein